MASRAANGKVPASALVLVQTGTYKGLPYSIYLETATAAAFEMAQKAGDLSISPPLGGNRSLIDQEHLKDEPGQYGSSLPSSKISDPGFSTHGYGDCVDIQAGNAWFQIHCGAYGFVRESPAGENNHYRYLQPTWAEKLVTTTASTGTTASINTEQDDEMALRGYIWPGAKAGTMNGALSDTSSGFWSVVSASQDYFNSLNASGIPFASITQSHANALSADHAAVREARSA